MTLLERHTIENMTTTCDGKTAEKLELLNIADRGISGKIVLENNW